MSTKKQSEIRRDLTRIQKELAGIRIDIDAENIDGQFDYCTDSYLASCVSSISSVVARIHKTVYQGIPA